MRSEPGSPGLTVETPPTPAQATLDEQFVALASLFTQTLRSLAGASPPPGVLRDARERGSLGKRHLPALLSITFSGSLSVSELAARLGLGLSTTSTLVGELSRAGLLERSEDEADHRRTIVRLDERHREEITVWARHVLAPLQRTLERLRPDERAVFLEGWRILHEEAAIAGERPGAQA
jgi:DNA-binding MarR family transcriptional regulator